MSIKMPPAGGLLLIPCLLAAAVGCGGGPAGPGAAPTQSQSGPPQLVQTIAESHISSFRGFEGSAVTAYQPMYDPKGNIDFWEAEVSKDGAPAGYVVVSATRKNRPIAEFAPGGTTHFAYFKSKLTQPFHMVRFGSGYLAALSDDGQLLADVGERPRLLPAECQPAGRGEQHREAGQDVVTPSPKPQVPPHCAAIKAARIDELLAAYDTFAPTTRDPSLQEKLTAQWSKAEALPQHRPVVHLDPGILPTGYYNYFFANGYDYALATQSCGTRQAHTYFLQIPPDVAPNGTGNDSGCGPTAWMNYFGWWSMNGMAGMLQGPHQFNILNGANVDNYANLVTMDLNSLLDVHGEPFSSEGYTYTWDVNNAYSWVTSALQPSGVPSAWYDMPGYWSRYAVTDADTNWIYAVARDAIITHHVPVVIDYSSDSHITVAYGLAENEDNWQTDSYLWINPGWHIDECQYGVGNGSKWISKDDLNGLHSITAMRQVRDFDFENAADTNAAPGFPTDPNGWAAVGSGASFKLEHALGTAFSGVNNGLIVLDKVGHSGLNKIRQAVTVEPYRKYKLTAMMRTGALIDQYSSYLAVNDPTQTTILGFTYGQPTGTLNAWTQVSLTFTTGNTNYVEIMAALFSNGTANGTQWLRVDDVNLTQLDDLEDGDFEEQPAINQAVTFPWSLKTQGPVSGGISQQTGGAYSGKKFAWLYNNACPGCGSGFFNFGPGTGSWSEFNQVIPVIPNANYQVTAYVNVNYNTLSIGVNDMRNSYPSSLGGQPAWQMYSAVTNQGWKPVTFTFNAGSNEMVQLYFGYTPDSAQAWAWLDDISVQRL